LHHPYTENAGGKAVGKLIDWAALLMATIWIVYALTVTGVV